MSVEASEKKGVREAMSEMKKHLVEHKMDPKVADSKVRELARDWDRRNGSK